MAGRMSNRDRIAQRAAEAEAARKEKEAKAAQKRAAPSARSRKAAPPGRTKIAWAVCDHTGAQVQLFPYREEAAARAEAQRRSEESGKSHFVTRTEVPAE